MVASLMKTGLTEAQAGEIDADHRWQLTITQSESIPTRTWCAIRPRQDGHLSLPTEASGVSQFVRRLGRQ
jgi:hypothetical protein